MADFPGVMLEHMGGACINPNMFPFSTALQAESVVVNYGFAAWPSANLGIYIPFTIDAPKTVKQMYWENSGVAGTTDVGIYDVVGNRVVSLGATTNAGTLQVGNITDTLLTPGTYYAGMVSSTVTTQTYWSAGIAVANLRPCGVQQQAIGSATLPNPATFAVMASAYIPLVGLSFQATM